MISLPQLEPSAALLLAQLHEATSQALEDLNFEKTILWSDSRITIHWINTSLNSLKTFVRNRVSDIIEITSTIKKCEWRHVRSESNPADLISRGLLPGEFTTASSWQSDPEWISDCENSWPKSLLEFAEIPEIILRKQIPSENTLCWK